jgi:hypothetical protein
MDIIVNLSVNEHTKDIVSRTAEKLRESKERYSGIKIFYKEGN